MEACPQVEPIYSSEERKELVPTNFENGGAGLKAMAAAERGFNDLAKRADASYDRLAELKIRIFIAQGSDDFIVLTVNSFWMQQLIPDGGLKIHPDSGHGFLYQYAEEFGGDVNRFLNLQSKYGPRWQRFVVHSLLVF